MKKGITFFLLLLLFLQNDSDAGIKIKGKAVGNFPFYIYSDYKNRFNYFSPSGFMGESQDIMLAYNCMYQPYQGTTCIKIDFLAHQKTGAGWAGIYWQYPDKNWGQIKGGYNLEKAMVLYFYAKGKNGGEIAEFKVGGIGGLYPDSDTTSLGLIELSNKWQRYEIDLSGLDLSYVIGGFCVIFMNQLNPEGCTIYLDEIYFNNTPVPEELYSLFTGYNHNSGLIKIAIKDFINKTSSKNYDYLRTVLPNLISAYLMKKNKFLLFDEQQITKLFLSIPDYPGNGMTITTDYLLNDIVKVDYIIEGDYQRKDDQLYVDIRISNNRMKLPLNNIQLSGSTDKIIFYKLDQFNEQIYRKITGK